LLFTYSQASIKDVQATRKAFSTLKLEKILHFFLFLWVNFFLSDPDPADQNQCGPYPSGSGSQTLLANVCKCMTYIDAERAPVFPILSDVKFLKIFGICAGGLTALGGSLADLPVDPQLGKERLFLSHNINNFRTGTKIRHC
jgi:hypothetical protein